MKLHGTGIIIYRIFWASVYSITPPKLVKRFILKGDAESRFTLIHRMNYWSNLESSSGGGSTERVTSNVREKLPLLIEDFKIGNICDAPCGEYSWMKSIIAETKIQYTGIDIVKSLIENNALHSENSEKFIYADIRKFNFNGYDLVLVRDCLFHFSYKDIEIFLANLASSNYEYLLTTSYKQDNSFANLDIETGDFRRIDLLSTPFSFPRDYLYEIEDWEEPERERFLYLWHKSQVPKGLAHVNSD